MTLELSKVAEQVGEMGRVLAERDRRFRRTLPAAQELLCQFANEQEFLCQVAESEAGRRLRCASPDWEPLDLTAQAPALADSATLIAADGSQIYPDHHGVAFYYVVNVGSIIFRRGSGQPPEVATLPQLCYSEEQVYPGGVPVSGDLVSAERSLAEMRMLAQLGVAEPAGQSRHAALADGPLLIWLQRAAVPEEQQARILTEYLDCLGKLQSKGVGLAGFVSRPRSAEVVALLYLAHLPPDERGAVTSLAETPFRGLTDRRLFEDLDPGHRSALFVRGTAANEDFRLRGHAIHFFYFNTGTEIARVEVPEWVAHDPERLDLIHAEVYEQCRFNNGYPYVLTRADELAVIGGEERRVLEDMIVRAIARHEPRLPQLSQKAQQKKVARWRRTR